MFVLTEIDVLLFNFFYLYDLQGTKTVIRTLYDSHFSYQTSYLLVIYILVHQPIILYISEHWYLLSLSYSGNRVEQVTHNKMTGFSPLGTSRKIFDQSIRFDIGTELPPEDITFGFIRYKFWF